VTLIAVIPARGGSQRIPGKNIRLFHGRPILDYSIKAAQDAGFFTRIYVSTDCPAISSVAYRAGADVIRRPDNLAKDSVGTQEVARDVIERVTADHLTLYPPKYACCIYATAPLMGYLDLIEGYAKLRASNAPYVYTVGQDWQDAGQWYWGTAAAFLASVSLDQGTLFPLPAHRVCDINTEDDWRRAEKMYAEIHGLR